MTLFNLFRRKPEPKPAVSPGELHIERKYDPVNPKRDTTVITYGGKLSSRKLVQVRALLSSKTAHIRRYARRGVQA